MFYFCTQIKKGFISYKLAVYSDSVLCEKTLNTVLKLSECMNVISNLKMIDILFLKFRLKHIIDFLDGHNGSK